MKKILVQAMACLMLGGPLLAFHSYDEDSDVNGRSYAAHQRRVLKSKSFHQKKKKKTYKTRRLNKNVKQSLRKIKGPAGITADALS